MPSPGALPPILLVDDNADDLFLLRQRLVRAGVQNPILSFEDAEEAMGYLKRAMADQTLSMPSLVFLDLRMPRCGGFEVLKWIRSQPALAALRVVIVSTSSLPEDTARASRLGAEQWVSKYPSLEMLVEIISRDPRRKK